LYRYVGNGVDQIPQSNARLHLAFKSH
jgi:hypothetical protein